MPVKRKATVHQMIEGFLYLGREMCESFPITAVASKKLSDVLKNRYEWEIHYLIFTMIYVIIKFSANIPKKDELSEEYIFGYRKYLGDELSEDDKKYICEQLDIRKMAYMVAWDNEGIDGVYKLFSNILSMIETDLSPNEFMNGYIEYARSCDKHINDFYTRCRVPSAHVRLAITRTVELLTGSINGLLSKFNY